MRRHLLAVTVAAGLAAAVVPAHAASAPKPQITDPAGDANGLNDEGLGAPVPSMSTPADVTGADITSVLLATTWTTKKVHHKKVKVPTGMTATMTLSAAPMPGVNYRIYASTALCSNLFFEYKSTPGAGGPDLRCPGSTPVVSKDTKYAVTVTTKGNTIVWTVPLKTLPVGTALTQLQADTRGNPVKLTAPVIDEASSAAIFVVGK